MSRFKALSLAMPFVLVLTSMTFLAGPASATHCNASIVSDSSTWWTHAEPPAGVVRSAAVLSSGYSGWTVIPAKAGHAAPAFIWKENNPSPAPTYTPVAFSRTFAHCDLLGGTGTLRINADDNFEVYVNGVYVGGCGLPSHMSEGRCWDGYSIFNVLSLAAENEIVILVSNWGKGSALGVSNGAMLQYRLDY